MRASAQLALAALAASLLLAASLSTASARKFSVSNNLIRFTWSSLEFSGEEIAVIRCPVTLEGSLHSRTIVKAERSLIGAITSGRVKQSSCTNGIAAVLNGTEPYNGGTSANALPWHVTYESFNGILPDITSVRILFARFLFGIRDNLGLCTARYGITGDNVTGTATLGAAGAITSLTPAEARNIASLLRADAGMFCPAIVTLRGSGQVMVLNTTTRISVTLI